MTTQVTEVRAELAEHLPPDAIRQQEACEKYGFTAERLSMWVNRQHVRQYARLSHKMRFVSENDIRKRLGLEPLLPEG